MRSIRTKQHKKTFIHFSERVEYMAGKSGGTKIRGMTLKIDGDTSGVVKALSGMNSQISNTQSQLKDIERLLKLDPKNTELLRQKQELLTRAIGETEEKLKKLENAEKLVQEQFKEGKISQDRGRLLPDSGRKALLGADLPKITESLSFTRAWTGSFSLPYYAAVFKERKERCRK